LPREWSGCAGIAAIEFDRVAGHNRSKGRAAVASPEHVERLKNFDYDDARWLEWTETLGRRAFPFEAFLSHNQFDQSDYAARELQRRGVSVWYDAHADLVDREVWSKVRIAIQAFRYVVVCVGRDFRNSPWVRAEYRPALAEEKRGALTRVLVLRMSADAPVPEELANSPMFATTDLDGFCSFLLKGNLLPADPTEVLARAAARSRYRIRARRQPRQPRKTNSARSSTTSSGGQQRNWRKRPVTPSSPTAPSPFETSHKNPLICFLLRRAMRGWYCDGLPSG
jgi:hypothetical protein